MNAKEKAEELVGKYAIKSYQLKLGISFDFDKQCALIAVDEIIETLTNVIWVNNEHTDFAIKTRYWYEVRNEIKKL